MAEVFAAFAALSSFLQVVDFCARVGSHAKELIESANNALPGNANTEQLAKEYRQLTTRILSSAKKRDDGSIDWSSDKISPQLRQAKRLSDQTESLLEDLQALKLDNSAAGPMKVISGTKKVLKSVKCKKDLDRQRLQLQELNATLATTLLVDIWDRNMPLAEAHFEYPVRRGDFNVEQVRLLARRREIEPILKALRFIEMSDRFRAIDPAWKDTYDWSLSGDATVLYPWLQSGKGIFWISGKAGSGKSTLMKHLSQSQRTEAHLRVWSGKSQLVVAHFFFWYAGTPKQKSIDGLLMSILYQILFVIPSLATVAFPGGIDQFISSKDDPEHPKDELSHTDLVDALKRVTEINPSTFGTDKSFCFFVDGLDEYNGNHISLVNILKSLASHPRVKICASSRPWNAFCNAFESKVPNLRLESLTQTDILRYISDKLDDAILDQEDFMESSSGDELMMLITEIANKAEGVFLWVVLAVRSVCEGIAEGDDVSFLRYRVSRLPSDLESFFKAILSRVDSIYEHQTYQALFLAWIQKHEDDEYAEYQFLRWTRGYGEMSPGYGRSFIDFWFIRQNPRGMIDMASAFAQEKVIYTEENARQMARQTSQFLSASCKDLLFLPSKTGREDTSVCNSMTKVEFLHRTVFDFFGLPEMQSLLRARVPAHFRDGTILVNLNINRVLLYLPGDIRQQKLDYLLDRSLSLDVLPWPTERFVQRVEEMSYGLIYLSDSRAMALFIAHQKHRMVFRTLDAQRKDLEVPTQMADDSAQSPIWRAALGESESRQFPVYDINLLLIRKLSIRYSPGNDHAIESSCPPTLPDDLGPCSLSARQMFLRKWHLSKPPASCDHAALLKRWRDIFDVAKVLFDGTFAYGQSEELFCQAPAGSSDHPHVHEWTSSTTLFNAHVPSIWLAGWARTVGWSTIEASAVDLKHKRMSDTVSDDSLEITKEDMRNA